MAPERMVSMSKKLQKRTSRLRRKAQSRVLAIGRAVREYRDATSTPGILDATWQTKKSQDIEVAVERYNQVHKKLRRINKKSVD
jgi:hypothetical protein